MDTSSVKGLTVLLTTIILILSLNAQNHRIQFEINAPEVNYTLTPNHNINYNNGIAWFKVTNKYEYDLLMQYINNFDYYPAKSAKVVQNVATHMVTPIKHPSVPSNSKGFPDGVKMTFSLRRPSSTVHLPFVLYNQVHNYKVMVNGKRKPTLRDNNNLLIIKNVPRGNSVVKVSYHNALITWLMVIMTIAGIISIILI